MTAFHESCRYCVSSEFTAAVADRDRRGHDQRRLVLADPQRVDDGVHQPQDAARALEALEARPVLVEPVEQLRVDRVGLLDPVLVGRRRAPRAGSRRRAGGTSRRTPRAVALIDASASASGCDEQPLADDVVGLVRRRGPPLVGDAPHDVLQPLQRLEAVRAADLLGVAGDRSGRRRRSPRRGSRSRAARPACP